MIIVSAANPMNLRGAAAETVITRSTTGPGLVGCVGMRARTVVAEARPIGCATADVDCAAHLLASALGYRHSVARPADNGQEAMHRELRFVADAPAAGAGAAPGRSAGGARATFIA